MITVTITTEKEEPFTVRFQSKLLKDGNIVWGDSEIVHEIGKSQAYGIDENFRLIIEDSSAEKAADA
ncbi:hypothetical protein [Bradyrhizobium sp. AS23.2]|uniref:hypothetical protein n=1 Tax=Bradyrhizobium sp. AS23.2 TaxID=1680155 RepID=UPI000938D86D|nr:hypothetical protein [Bradyrhizobium sp. AS23.2]OKO69706.1 hypothetical protein AC630_36245 [Bradyrhizobium sp. AS23.2]